MTDCHEHKMVIWFLVGVCNKKTTEILIKMLIKESQLKTIYKTIVLFKAKPKWLKTVKSFLQVVHKVDKLQNTYFLCKIKFLKLLFSIAVLILIRVCVKQQSTITSQKNIVLKIPGVFCKKSLLLAVPFSKAQLMQINQMANSISNVDF